MSPAYSFLSFAFMCVLLCEACPFQYDDVAAIFLQRLLGETQI